MNLISFKKENFNSLEKVKEEFNLFLKQYYKEKKRILPWRENINSYYIFVSEFMLQQTQVSRVINYFNTFIEKFPTFNALSQAPQSAILESWSGLGYNRRAMYLHQGAKVITEQYKELIPSSVENLKKIKGIGEYTASALVTYSYNIPTIFVETNIRTVCFSIFEQYFNEEKISDKKLIKLIEQIIDRENPREWYYAMMDLGTELKKILPQFHLKKSSSYQKQSLFLGSIRAIRGKIIKFLTKNNQQKVPREELELLCNDERFDACITNLIKEGLIEAHENFLYLKK
jgi:A/G-specific adenine glycosylase